MDEVSHLGRDVTSENQSIAQQVIRMDLIYIKSVKPAAA